MLLSRTCRYSCCIPKSDQTFQEPLHTVTIRRIQIPDRGKVGRGERPHPGQPDLTSMGSSSEIDARYSGDAEFFVLRRNVLFSDREDQFEFAVRACKKDPGGDVHLPGTPEG